jgi:hypothetical protein
VTALPRPRQWQLRLALSRKLLLGSEDRLEVCYAPFEHVERIARVVLLGIPQLIWLLLTRDGIQLSWKKHCLRLNPAKGQSHSP